MPDLIKRADRWGFLAAIESSYATPVALVDGTHGILALEEPAVEMGFIYDGRRRGDRTPGSGQRFPRVAKSGRFGSIPFVGELQGPAAAYNGTTQTVTIQEILRACGLQRTVVTTGGSESETFAPRASAFESMSTRSYFRGEQHELIGVRGSLTLSAEPGAPVICEAALQGIYKNDETTNPSDVALPAITYRNVAVEPPKFINVPLAIGNWAAGIVRGFTLTQNAVLTARVDAGIDEGHAGFAFAHGDAELELLVEAAAFTASPYHAAGGLNPRALMELSTKLALVIGPWGAQYNRFTVNAFNAQVEEVGDDDEGPNAIWALRFSLPVSNPALTADWNLVAS